MSTEFVIRLNCLRLGFHIGKEPTLEKTFGNLIEAQTPLNSFQIYLANRSGYTLPNPTIDDIIRTRRLLESNFKYLCIHTTLCTNLCGSTDHENDPQFDNKLEGTISRLSCDLDIAAALGAGVVVHTGTCKNKDKGIDTIVNSIHEALTRDTKYSFSLSERLGYNVKNKRKIILENCAGEKNKIGSSLDDIIKIYKLLPSEENKKVKLCIDTQHIFGAGEYDFGKSTEVIRFYDDLENSIGIDRLELFHLNDSKVRFGGKADRHENLCLGYQFGNEMRNDGYGIEGLTTFLYKAKENRRIPLIGEPPRDGSFDYEIINSILPLEYRYKRSL